MPKHSSEKLWDLTHKDKLKEYQAKYFSDKIRINLILDNETVEAINKLNSEDISLAGKVKAIIKDWINTERE
ncbi:MAG: hypothetical protein WBB28_13225 [Crinalium sp.]